MKKVFLGFWTRKLLCNPPHSPFAKPLYKMVEENRVKSLQFDIPRRLARGQVFLLLEPFFSYIFSASIDDSSS